MLIFHRDGEPRVEIPKQVEDEGPAAVEAYVAGIVAAASTPAEDVPEATPPDEEGA